MNKRKIRFNFVDVIIILIIVVAALILAKVFLGGNENNVSNDAVVSRIQYVIELQDVDERFDNLVTEGQPVQDAIQRKNIGYVVGVQAIPYEIITFDYVEGKEKVSVVDGRNTVYITIEADAVETDSAFTVDGCIIRVGQKYSIVTPNMYGNGFCIKLTKIS